ncbi:CD276 antigen-like isoform X2 [Poeciliopsis prolifica]|nr:CD276 antigen-like isoform X2 [Poeciliopsis prolifica]
MLPCRIQLGSDPLIHWIKLPGETLRVHSYYDGRDQLGHQNQNFQNRTSLFLDQISGGNASLLLKEVKIQDEGRYKCYTSTTSTGYKESFINLKAEAPGSDIRIHQDGNRTTCSSEGIYPQPELTWSTEPPSNTTLQNRTTVHQTEEKLYDISSSLIDPDGSDRIYSCTIRTRSNQRRATYKKPGTLHQEEQEEIRWWLIGLIAAVVILIIGGIVGFVHKRCKKSKNESQSASGGNPQSKEETEMDHLNSNTNGPASEQESRKQENKKDSDSNEPKEMEPLKKQD